jgi:hypothetical protein
LGVKLHIVLFGEVPDGVGILVAGLGDEGFGFGDIGGWGYSACAFYPKVRALGHFRHQPIHMSRLRLKGKPIYHLHGIEGLIRYFEHCFWGAYPLSARIP